MKKNSLELKRRQHQMLIEAEERVREKRERRMASKALKEQIKPQSQEEDVTMKKAKFKRGRVLPRREYKAKRRTERLERNAPELIGGEDVDMENQRAKRVIPVSKSLRLVKDKHSITK